MNNNNNNNKENERMKEWNERIWMIMKIQKREIGMINDNDKMKKWTDECIGDEGARMISESLKTNTTLTTLGLSSDEKWSKMKWIIKIIKKTKEWNNEI